MPGKIGSPRAFCVPPMEMLLSLALIFLAACDGGSERGLSREQYRAGATALFQQQLYQEAVDWYRAYLASPVIPPEDVAKVLYQIGVIQQDHLKQTQAALGSFSLVKVLAPQQAFAPDLGKRMVACLEASGRSAEASQALSALTRLPGDSAPDLGDGAVLAEVEGRKIPAGEVAAALGGKLPEAPVERAQALRQYVGQILLAESARRRGMAGQGDVKRMLDMAETQILAQAALRADLKAPAPRPDDLRNFYAANKARYAADTAKPFAEIEPRVRADWTREKQAGAYVELVERLLQSAQVRFYDGKESR